MKKNLLILLALTFSSFLAHAQEQEEKVAHEDDKVVLEYSDFCHLSGTFKQGIKGYPLDKAQFGKMGCPARKTDAGVYSCSSDLNIKVAIRPYLVNPDGTCVLANSNEQKENVETGARSVCWPSGSLQSKKCKE